MEQTTWWDTAYTSGEFRRHWDMLYPSQELVAIAAAGLIPDGASTLDIGCGAGTEAVFLAQQGFRSIGVDLSGEALRIAKTRAEAAGVNVDFRTGSALDLPVRDGSVEFANDRGCFHHIPEEQRGRYAQELARVLKPGGKVLLRGCRQPDEGVPFVLVTPEAVQQHFSAEFSFGPVIPVEMFSENGQFHGNMVLLEKK